MLIDKESLTEDKNLNSLVCETVLVFCVGFFFFCVCLFVCFTRTGFYCGNICLNYVLSLLYPSLHLCTVCSSTFFPEILQ